MIVTHARLGLIQNGQEPKTNSLDMPVLVGSGRLATHFNNYFSLINKPILNWDRKSSNTSLADFVKSKSPRRVLLAISDKAIPDVIDSELNKFNGTIIHFSGALHHPKAYGVHPLMTFSHRMYSLADYEKIHFVISSEKKLSELLPEFSNTFTIIKPSDQAFYHALCVLSGNFPQLLWQKAESDFTKLNIPRSVLHAYIQKISENFILDGPAAVTGPLVRNDLPTLQKNMDALKNDPWLEVYKAFVHAMNSNQNFTRELK